MGWAVVGWGFDGLGGKGFREAMWLKVCQNRHRRQNNGVTAGHLSHPRDARCDSKSAPNGVTVTTRYGDKFILGNYCS